MLHSMDMRDSPGRTYRFYTGKFQYPFGYGNSYTQFTYNAAEAYSHKHRKNVLQMGGGESSWFTLEQSEVITLAIVSGCEKSVVCMVSRSYHIGWCCRM